MDENTREELLDDLNPDRRAFVKRVAAITAFAAPMIASYDLAALAPSADALTTYSNSLNQTLSFNQTAFSGRH